MMILCNAMKQNTVKVYLHAAILRKGVFLWDILANPDLKTE